MHQIQCIENAEISVRENCAEKLTAAPYDTEAWNAQNTWVRSWAEEWVQDGTSTCICKATT